VFIPKYRKRANHGTLRRRLGDVFRTLAEQKESRFEEGHLMPDHVHTMISIPPKHSVVRVVAYIKGQSAIHIARHQTTPTATPTGHAGLPVSRMRRVAATSSLVVPGS
jgi:putative transposase